MAYVNDTSLAHHGLLFRLGETIKLLGERLEQRKVYRQTIAELSSLSSRELQDLGLNRSMIQRLAHEAAYGKN